MKAERYQSIWADDRFSTYDYWEVYATVVGGGERSARGVKTMISRRLAKLSNAKGATRAALIEKVSELVEHLYSRHQRNQAKLEEIRRALDK